MRGRADADDVIDLHGMTQIQAHAALRAFLFRTRRNGARLVLIITGKGRSGGSFPSSGGILRQAVPHWLRAPDLRPLIIGFEEAGPMHGGAGALYVRIRRDRHPTA